MPLTILAPHIGGALVAARFRFGRLAGSRVALLLWCRLVRTVRRVGRIFRSDLTRRDRRRHSIRRLSFARSLGNIRWSVRLSCARWKDGTIRFERYDRLNRSRDFLGRGNLRRKAAADFLEAEAGPLFLGCGESGGGAGHLADQPRDGRIFKRQRNGGVLHAPHGIIIIGNLPLGRPGESLRDLLFSNAQRTRLKPVEHDFQLGHIRREVLRDQAV